MELLHIHFDFIYCRYISTGCRRISTTVFALVHVADAFVQPFLHKYTLQMHLYHRFCISTGCRYICTTVFALVRIVDTFCPVAGAFVRLHFHLYKPIIHLYMRKMDCRVWDWEGEVWILFLNDAIVQMGF